MKERLLKRLHKTEPGDGGISYAMYFVAIVTSLVIVCFLKFNADLYITEEVCENGLHIVESGALSVNSFDIMDRTHIIPAVTTLESVNMPENSIEDAQVNAVGRYFETAFKEQFELTENVHPSGGILAKMCGTDSQILIDSVKIYEPIYKTTVIKTSTGETINIGGHSIVKQEFKTVYSLMGWVEYELLYDNNVYQRFVKNILTDTPVLSRGDNAEGATIEATIGLQFAGVRNIFAGVSTQTPVITGKAENGDYNINMSGIDKQMFSSSPTQMVYDVQVTQALDIVIADMDSRKNH